MASAQGRWVTGGSVPATRRAIQCLSACYDVSDYSLQEALEAAKEAEGRLEDFKKHLERIKANAKPGQYTDQHDTFKTDLRGLQVDHTHSFSPPPPPLHLRSSCCWFVSFKAALRERKDRLIKRLEEARLAKEEEDKKNVSAKAERKQRY